MARGLSREDVGRLLTLLKANAEEMARELRDAGWVEDERGLWRKGWGPRLHLLDAHESERNGHD